MSDYRDDRYGSEPDDEDYYTYDASDEDEEGRKRPLMFLAIVALIVLFGGVVFFAYKQGLRQGAETTPPLIRADQSPAKRAPDNPGGIEIPHQDKTIYERLSGSQGGQDAENLLPREEEPMRVQTAKPVTPAAPVESPVVPVSPAPVTAVPDATIPSTTVPATSGPVTSGQVTGGTHVLQLASVKDEASARSEFAKLQGKFPQLAGLSADIERADLGDKGIFYRIRAGYLDKDKAQAVCDQLKAAGQACLLRPR